MFGGRAGGAMVLDIAPLYDYRVISGASVVCIVVSMHSVVGYIFEEYCLVIVFCI
jgi:hypothetical protein